MSALFMRPANELVAEGFERARRDRRTCAFLAERIAALKAQVANGKISEDAAALSIRHLEAVLEMIGLGLHHIGEGVA